MTKRLPKAGAKSKPRKFVVIDHGPNGSPRPMGTKTVEAESMAQAVASVITEDADYVTVHHIHGQVVIRPDRRSSL